MVCFDMGAIGHSIRALRHSRTSIVVVRAIDRLNPYSSKEPKQVFRFVSGFDPGVASLFVLLLFCPVLVAELNGLEEELWW